MNQYLKGKKWAQFGMNAAIGAPADALASPAQEMYLPDNLMKHLDRAKIGGQPLVQETRTLFEPAALPALPIWQDILNDFTRPNGVFLILFGLVLWVQKKKPAWLHASFQFDKLFFGFVGFWGCFVLLLWVATDHGVTNWNQNLLWLMPLHLPFAFLLGKPKYQSLLRAYVKVSFVLLLGMFVIGLVGALVKQTQWIPVNCVFLLALISNRLSAVKHRLSTE